MQLTPFQYRALKIYWRYHTGGFTVAQVLRSSWKQWALAVVCVLIAFFFVTPTSPALGCLAMGLFGGSILRDFGHYRVAFLLWPVSRELYDWKKVSEFIELHEKDAA
jgi:hypothetical protein